MPFPKFPQPRKPPPAFGEGCWYTQNPYGANGDALKGLFQMWPKSLIFEANVDCDCHLRGWCMPGEPPLPPMAEFLMDPNINPGWRALPAKNVNGKIPNSHTYRVKGWTSHGAPDGFPLGDADTSQHTHENWKRDNIGLEPNHRKREPILRQKDTPYKVLAMLGPQRYRSSVIRAFHKLPASKQLIVTAKWPDFKIYTKDTHGAMDLNHAEFDPRPALAILLADPRGWAGSAVQAMDQRYANLLLHCADAAVSSMLEKTMEEILDHAPRVGNSGQDRAKDESRIAMTSKRLEYYEVFKHYALLWETATPEGLGRGHHEDETFSFETKIDLPKKLQNKPQAVQFVTVSSNDICETINTEAFSDVGTKGSFVADFDTIMRSLDQHMQFGENNTVMDAMKLPLSLEAMAGDLDWTPEALPKIFTESYHTVQLGLSYLSLSAWLGIGR